jgi:hypothetical protein
VEHPSVSTNPTIARPSFNQAEEVFLAVPGGKEYGNKTSTDQKDTFISPCSAEKLA